MEGMQLGVVFPQTEIGPDPAGVRAFAEAAQELGFRHLLAYDHVLGADVSVRPDWPGPYTAEHQFHEILVLFGYLAAAAPGLELVTGVLVLPQRQTALVAKQAAEIDILTGGQFRLGVGLGWNFVEFEALGEEFGNRGRRAEEQIELLRRLWTEPSVTFRGADEQVIGAGLAPLPVQRPIPVWFGAQSPAAYKRAGRLADGWFPQVPPGPKLDAARAMVEEAAVAAGRDPAALGMEGRVSWTGDVATFTDHVGRWQRSGASHLSVNTMGAGLGGVDRHLAALEQVAGELGLKPPGSA
jgi:probable F420-dependent oxidoreductase